MRMCSDSQSNTELVKTAGNSTKSTINHYPMPSMRAPVARVHASWSVRSCTAPKGRWCLPRISRYTRLTIQNSEKGDQIDDILPSRPS